MHLLLWKHITKIIHAHLMWFGCAANAMGIGTEMEVVGESHDRHRP
jgi:hypothetical protein